MHRANKRNEARLRKRFEQVVQLVSDKDTRKDMRKAGERSIKYMHSVIYPGFKSVTPSEIDHAMLAAYIDGEGCIELAKITRKRYGNASPGKAKYEARIKVTNTDPRLIQWLLERWGGSADGVFVGTSIGFNWHCTTADREAILLACRPFFVIKKEQCDVALALIGLQKGPRPGRPGDSPERIAEKERLRIAMRELKAKRVMPGDAVKPFNWIGGEPSHVQ